MSSTFDSDAFYERMYKFGLNCALLTKTLQTTGNLFTEYRTQLIRSSGSVGANYIEALEALSKKDFIHRLKISRKEARESVHWLRLIKDLLENEEVTKKITILIHEAEEIKRILTSSILTLETR